MSKQLIAGVLTLGFLFTGVASAADPLSVIKTVDINASATAVWQKVAKFGDLGIWLPPIDKTQITTGTEGNIGADRTLTLADGGKIYETLTAYNAHDKSMTYVITKSVLPLTEYEATLRVLPNGNHKSIAVWESHFVAKPSSDDAAALKTIQGIFEGGLANLKKISE